MEYKVKVDFENMPHGEDLHVTIPSQWNGDEMLSAELSFNVTNGRVAILDLTPEQAEILRRMPGYEVPSGLKAAKAHAESKPSSDDPSSTEGGVSD